MRGLILAAGTLLAASPAWGQTANNPTFTREQQGASIVSGQITCAATSTTVYAGNGDARAITVSAADANGVYVCVQTGTSSPATPAPCTAATASAYLGAAGQNLSFDRSVKNVSVSCVRAASSDAKINFIVQK